MDAFRSREWWLAPSRPPALHREAERSSISAARGSARGPSRRCASCRCTRCSSIRDPSPLAALPRLRTLGVAQTHLSPADATSVKRLAARGVVR
jgi:hypothetical protein